MGRVAVFMGTESRRQREARFEELLEGGISLEEDDRSTTVYVHDVSDQTAVEVVTEPGITWLQVGPVVFYLSSAHDIDQLAKRIHEAAQQCCVQA
jgi:hypothetical protein